MRDRTYLWVIRAFQFVFRVLGVRFDMQGARNIPSSGGAVVACNHIGFLDFTFVERAAITQGRLIRFMAKRSVFAAPVAGSLMRAMRHIPVDRPHGPIAYRQAIRAVQAGEIVGIFPEATMSRAWTLKPFKLGAASLAVREQVPLIPVAIWGGHRIATVDGRWSLRRGVPVTILVGEPILTDSASSVKSVNSQLYAQMQILLDSVQRDYPARPRNQDDRWWLPRHLGGTAPTPEQAAVADAQAVARVEQRLQAKRRKR
jgi:1-acyl-sn-glycerol-3-phosphate acyltransferase